MTAQQRPRVHAASRRIVVVAVDIVVVVCVTAFDVLGRSISLPLDVSRMFGVMQVLSDQNDGGRGVQHRGVELRGQRRGHRAPDEVERVAGEPRGDERQGHPLGRFVAPVCDDLGQLRHAPRHDADASESEGQRVSA